ncbi:hydrogenase formation protein HypD [Paenibacillus polymyxa]|uniref:Hydrogenase formation protein HypD n=1 Tax=Paenibacillus polymyxa TaxID=1406 RepID=A0A8I1INF9_PAEPO|nr:MULTISPECIES: hydrogenase formation protein HypD [Paenibacillus]KAF6575297.1 hydrogenase formation protein HypD [Paenibacillus sp. EKM206P]KAF6590030.1 hydrogenase formation protein HypD [Paenibacillus sp. EKM205P]MBM0632626.1 hydrogenase formation protein HypD [Paenibacillus polymyxa]
MNLMSFRDPVQFEQMFIQMEPHFLQARERLGRKLRFMEVCGTHSVAFSKTGLRQRLSPYIDLISGPGCPVCVTAQSDIDQMIAYANIHEVILATYGDMMKVPGSYSNLEKEKANGTNIHILNSASEAIDLAIQNPNKTVILLAVGFETTAPSVALSILRAKENNLSNFFVYSAHKLTPPALDALLDDSEHQLDGFLLPGHVSVIIGRRGWLHLESLNVPAVIGGFEPIDMLMAVGVLTMELNRPDRKLHNLYPRFVAEEGNAVAQKMMDSCFISSSPSWRGFGDLPDSGLQIRREYSPFDASIHLITDKQKTKEIKGCQCSEIVKGKMSPFECKLFGKACTPSQPLGPCMVSAEGTCSTYYHYERNKERTRS